MTGLQTMIFDDVFKNKIPLPDKLLSYGFSLDEGTYVYNCKIVDNQFDLTVYIAQSGQVYTKVIDSSTGDEYRLHLVESVVGSFIGKVRADYLDVLQKMPTIVLKPKYSKVNTPTKSLNTSEKNTGTN